MRIGKKADGGFHTSGTAAWPKRLCKKLAELIVSHFLCFISALSAQETGEGTMKAVPVKEGKGEERRTPGTDDPIILESLGEYVRSTRRKITEADIHNLQEGKLEKEVYIGRGAPGAPATA